ncbi:MAG: hypothetical protein EOP53_27380 [Sphingobacteriales bacterium]|nr:MAG: hypothetical protein EOP53_27380 [Sphingobacteriales bacterium]
MKVYKFGFLVLAFFLIASCNKEVEVSPANLVGDWTHYHELDNYFDGMRFMQNGEFFYTERYGYEKKVHVVNPNGEKYFYTTEDRKVSIFRKYEANNTDTLLRAFEIKTLTKGRLIEKQDDYMWKRED